MVSVFDYMDYREYLKDFYQEAHSLDRNFSHRKISELLGDKSPSFFLKVIQDGRKLKPAQLEILPGILKMSAEEGAYFRALCSFAHARQKGEREYWLKQIVAHSRVACEELDPSLIQFYSDWIHSAVRAALSFIDVTDDDVSPLVKDLKPRPTPKEVKASLLLLSKLGLIERNEQGFWKPVQDGGLITRRSIHDSVLREYRLRCLDLARASVLRPDDAWPAKFFTNTASVSDEAWMKIQDRLLQFRKEVRAILKEDEHPPVRVVQLLNVAYSMTEKKPDEK